MRVLRSTLLATSLLVAGACTDAVPTAVPIDDGLATKRAVETPTDGIWARVVTGRTGPGSLYELYIPSDWNGDAVFFAHGVISPYDPIALPDDPFDWDRFVPVRERLGALGYAVAYSTYSENGLAVKVGAQQTHQLRGLLASQLKGQPDESYLIGNSLGALVALSLAERFPKQYDGALLMCGMVGGTALEVQFLGDVRALFDFYFPGVLPGDATTVPPGTQMTPQLAGQVIAAVTASPESFLKLLALASTRQTPIAYQPIGSLTDPTSIAFQTFMNSLIRYLGAQLVFANDVYARTHRHSAYHNEGVVYEPGALVVPHPLIPTLIAASNAGVRRYETTPDAANYLDRHYQPTGELEIPVLSVHAQWDYLAPSFHGDALREIVDAAGAGDMLVVRDIQRYGHCSAFTTDEVIGWFQELVAWSEGGATPTP